MRAVSIRNSLLRNLMLIILVLAGGIAAITEYGTRQLVFTLSRSIILHTLDFTESRLREFLTPVPAALQAARGWAEAGLLADLDPGSLNRLFLPIIRQFPQIASVRVADADGGEYMLVNRDGRWLNRETRAGSRRTRVRWTSPGDSRDSTAPWESSDYDPRRRAWYQSALAAGAGAVRAGGHGDEDPGGTSWTPPYPLSGGAPGITASTAARADGALRIVAFDIQLTSVSAFASTLSVSDRGGVVVLTDDGRIVGAPEKVLANQGISLNEVLLRRPGDIGWELASDAASMLRETGPDASPVRFGSAGEAYWGQARRFPLSSRHALFVAVVVPEADLLGTLPRLRLWVLATALVVILVALLQAFALSRRYSRPIEALVDESDRISRGDFERSKAIDSTIMEVRRLADAHDRMRDGLKSLMRLERDLKIARQIQQHTFPDRLPVLEGFEVDAFSEPAAETGGDTYDVVTRLQSGKKADRPTHAVMLLADVTGHGIGPALTAVQVQAMLRVAVRMGGDLLTIVRHLNGQLTAGLFGGRFITAWLGELDVARYTLTWFSAGQAPLIHYRAAAGDFDILEADAPPFGINESMEIRKASRCVLAPGDIFAVFSDGVFESQSVGGERFGQARILRIISEHCGETSATILLELRKSLAEFGGGRLPSDDRTAMIIKRD